MEVKNNEENLMSICDVFNRGVHVLGAPLNRHIEEFLKDSEPFFTSPKVEEALLCTLESA